MFPETIPVPVRLSKLTVELIDQQAKLRRMNRSTWMRETIMCALKDQQQNTDLAVLGQQLSKQIAAVVDQVNKHTTREIDNLTSN